MGACRDGEAVRLFIRRSRSPKRSPPTHLHRHVLAERRRQVNLVVLFVYENLPICRFRTPNGLGRDGRHFAQIVDLREIIRACFSSRWACSSWALLEIADAHRATRAETGRFSRTDPLRTSSP